MAIEIRQLVIRAVVEESGRQGTAAGPDPTRAVRTGERGHTPSSLVAADAGASRADVVSQCVRQVLRELRKVRER
jgi:hypothetical protein